MDAAPEKQKDYTPEILLSAGYIMFFCLASAVCLAFYFYTFVQKQSAGSVNVIATNLPSRTPTPHINPAGQSEAPIIFADDFSNDDNRWILPDGEGHSLSVEDGKLFLESKIDNEHAIAECRECPYLDEPYYLQADLATTTATNEDFGIVFNFNPSRETFYLLSINTESKEYSIYHLGENSWSRRLEGGSLQIKSFPNPNTLGIYADSGIVEIYINGQIVDSFVQTGEPFHFGYFGFYVDDEGFELSVDNLIISKPGK
ncbi:MAG: hypothetical protein DPW18_16710 [Chloroflexi bacterium]|nr:hypothetical protein [Chloroflexota bacterium]MDL1944652.1 hypothetical protein [Chloroflexi bacterium CFX2]